MPWCLGSRCPSFSLARATRVRLSVYDTQGRRVAELLDEIRPAGDHVATWDGRDASGRHVAQGTYWTRLSFGDETHVRKLVIVR